MKVDMREMYEFTKSQFEHAVPLGSKECGYLKGVSDAYYMASINCLDEDDLEFRLELMKRYEGTKRAEYQKGFYEAGTFALKNM